MDSARDKIANTELSPEEVYDLGRRSAEGDLSARETLILAHLPLVKKMANKFKGRGVDYDDLYQEGCYGLIEAVIRYDYTRGTPLGAYAYYWINKRIRKALLTQSKNIPMTIGEKDYYTMCRVFRAYHDIYAEKGHIPTYADLADASGVSEGKVKKLFSAAKLFSSLDDETVQSNSPMASAEDVYFQDEDPLSLFPVQLTNREKTVLQLYLGLLPGSASMSFQEVSAKVYWSTETVRNTYYSAVSKLRDALANENTSKSSDPFE